MSEKLPNMNSKTVTGRRFVIIEKVTKPVGICNNGVFTIGVFNSQDVYLTATRVIRSKISHLFYSFPETI